MAKRKDQKPKAESTDQNEDAESVSKKPVDGDSQDRITEENTAHPVDGADKALDATETETEASTTDVVTEELIETEDTVEPEPTPIEDTTSIAPPAPIKEAVIQKQGFGGGLMGGAIAAVLGFGAAQIYPDGWPIGGASDELTAQIADQQGTIDSLRSRIDDLTAEVATKASTDAVAAGDSETASSVATQSDALAALEAQIGDGVAPLVDRIVKLENRPLAESTDAATAAAIMSYDEKVAALRAETDMRLSNAQAMLATQLAETKELFENNAAKEAAAAQAAQRAAEAKAMLDIKSAMQSGKSFAEPLNSISTVEIPVPLQRAAETGVVTQSSLQDAFPQLARDALQVALKDASGDSAGSRLGTFLRMQMGARSLAPKEGDDPDAVLSRVEAAVRQGDLSTAVETLNLLPESGQAVLANWKTQAQSRLEVTLAADALAARLNSN